MLGPYAIIDERIINSLRKHMSQTIDVKRYEELAHRCWGAPKVSSTTQEEAPKFR